MVVLFNKKKRKRKSPPQKIIKSELQTSVKKQTKKKNHTPPLQQVASNRMSPTVCGQVALYRLPFLATPRLDQTITRGLTEPKRDLSYPSVSYKNNDKPLNGNIPQSASFNSRMTNLYSAIFNLPFGDPQRGRDYWALPFLSGSA